MTKPNLNVAQWETLKEQFVELIVDGMDYKTMEQYVTEQLTNYYDGLSYHELEEEVNNHDEELFDELVDNVSIENDNERRQHLEEIKYDREVN